MPELRELQRKLESITALREIVHAMRNLAAVYVRRAETSLDATRPYGSVVATALSVVMDRMHLQTAAADPGPPVALVLASDQGLCGTYNERVVRRTLQFREEYPETTFMAIGQRGCDALGQHGIEPALAVRAPTSLEGITAQILDLADQVFTAFSATGRDRLFLIYNVYESMGRFSDTVRQVLPPDRQSLESDDSPEFGYDPILTALPELLLDRLMEEHFFISLFCALLESHASENGARLLSMTAASTNIDKRIAELTKEYQGARQEVVTSELLDVVGGAEALRAG